MGWSLTGFIVFNILINLAIFLATIFKKLKMKTKSHYAAKSRTLKLKMQEELNHKLKPKMFNKQEDLELNGNLREFSPHENVEAMARPLKKKDFKLFSRFDTKHNLHQTEDDVDQDDNHDVELSMHPKH